MLLLDLPDTHDLGHLTAALSYIDGRRTAIDGGAHRGIWTRELANHFDRVIAFEPLYELADQIEGAEVVMCSLSNKRGACLMKHGHENNGQAHIWDVGRMCPMTTIDEYAIEDLDFLKLDIEGFELFALEGAEETLKRCHPAILVEMNGLAERYGYSDIELHEWLAERGYTHTKRWNKDHLYL